MKAKLLRWLLPIILLITLGIVYSLTLAPDLTWANRGADGGDLITAAATGGVAHPPGYPTYLTLARLFQMLPVGTVAFRTNLLSMVCGLLAALVVADLARRSCPGRDAIARFVGFVAGLAFGLSPLFWSQAVITEVYTLHTLFVALILWLTLLSQEVQLFPLRGASQKAGLLNRVWLDRIGGLLFGLALGNQLTVIFLLPVWLLVGIMRKGEGELGSMKGAVSHPRTLAPLIDWHSLARRLGWLLLGLSIYIVIPLWARSGSPVNWGYAVDWDGFWWLVSGELYQDRVLNLPIEYLWPRIRNWAGWLQTQFGLAGLVLGFYGLLYGKPRSNRFYWITGWMFLNYSIFSVGYSSTDSYALLIPAYMAFALWLGLGVGKLLEEVENWNKQGWLIPFTGLIAIGFILLNAWMIYPDVDASQDMRAVEFSRTVMEIAPMDAIILTMDDEDVFALRYYTYALGQRPDIAVLSGALTFEWYREVMRDTYPGLIIPDEDCYSCLRSTLITVNARPVCESLFDSTEVLRCGLTE
ncbi:MAG: DUF2723 domain-containing protein [Anaerolineae bacterium]|nr:DUF2723 domain-containing protein [Anaerolineae bacterium]